MAVLSGEKEMSSSIETRLWGRSVLVCECWEYQGTNWKGYGSIWYDNRMERAHRVAWRLIYGGITDGLWVLHTCDNRACVNPMHLYEGTQVDNMRDMVVRGRSLRGLRVNHGKLSDEDVVNIRYGYRRGITQAALALIFEAHNSTISRVITGQTHTDGWQKKSEGSEG